MEPEIHHETSTDSLLTQRVTQLEERVAQLQQTLSTRAKNLWIGVAVSFAVFAGLLMIHWAGHFARTVVE